jgi:hypothetical protein
MSEFTLVANRYHQNAEGSKIVHMKSYINMVLQRTKSYTQTKKIMRNKYHIFIHIERISNVPSKYNNSTKDE